MPVYNAAGTVESSLDSVIGQSFGDFEIICVDDGSTDESYRIIDSYCKKDSRIKLIRQSNQFAGVARNNGIENSQGRYITFLDADDLMQSNCLEVLYNRAEETNADVVRSSAFSEINGNRVELSWCLNKKILPNKDVFSWKDCGDNLFMLSAGNPWGMMVKSDFIKKNNIKFPSFPRTEDVVFTYMCYIKAEKITTVPDLLINYRVQSTGMESTKIKYPTVPLEARRYLKEKIVETGLFDNVKNGFLYREFVSFLDMLERLLKNKEYGIAEKYYQEIRNEVESNGLKFDKRRNCNDLYLDLYLEMHKIVISNTFEEYCAIKGTVNNNKPYKFNLGIQPLVSIIVPVHNSELYLKQCLNSILNQTIDDYELILVDDGSKDNSLKIINGYKEMYPNKIIVIHQKASGAGEARNNGMKYAHGKYLLFLDSDDTFKNTMLESAVKVMDKTWCDIVIFGANTYNNATKQYYGADWLLNFKYVDKMTFKPGDVSDQLFQITTPNPWNKMYKSNFIWETKLEFQNLPRANDVVFTYTALTKAKKICILNERLINWRTNNQSSLQGSNTKTPDCFLKAYEQLKENLIKNSDYELYEQSYINVLISNIVYTINSLKTIKSKIRLLKKLKKLFKQYKILDKEESYYYEIEKYAHCLDIRDLSVCKYIQKYDGVTINSVIKSIKKDGLLRTIKK